MRRDMTVCRARKAAGMNCKNCFYFASCPEQAEKRKAESARANEIVPGTNWTRFEISKLEDMTLTIRQAAEAIGITPARVRYYREKNGLIRRRRRKKDAENIYQWENQRNG